MQQVTLMVGREFADVVAELAFEIFRIEWGSLVDANQPEISVEAFQLAKATVAKGLLGSSLRQAWLLSQKNVPSEVRSLVRVYSSFFSKLYAGVQLTFRPKLKGAGIVRAVEADICTADTLIEVKTVKRNLTSHDFRQILTYLALGAVSGEYSWEHAVIFNPRRAIFYSFNVPAFVSYLSARTAAEAFESLIYFVSQRDDISN